MERSCTACDRKVHDLSGCSDDEVRALLATGPACIRYLYDASGRRLHELPEGATLVPARALLSRRNRQRWLRAAALANAVIVLEACGGNDGGRRFEVPGAMPGARSPDSVPAELDEDAGADAVDAGAASTDAASSR